MCHNLGRNSSLMTFPLRTYVGLIPGELVVLQNKKTLMRYLNLKSYGYSCLEKGCPTKPYATMPKSIMGNGGSWSLSEASGVTAT